jgi:hypothetical protein
MNMDTTPILDTIDPEYVDRLATRRAEIERGSWARPGVVAALAIGSVPIALAALSRDVYAQSALPTAVQSAINFALALEIFENEFYKAVLGTSSSAAQNGAFATVRALLLANPVFAASVQQIQKHEQAHVDILTASGAVNTLALTAASFDFTGNGSAAGGGPFAKATTNLGFLLQLAQGAEDTGVRAYKGQAVNLMASPTVLETALRIHSVEARHASRIRRIRRSLNTGVSALRYSGTVSGGATSITDVPAAGITDPGDAAAVTTAFARIYGAGANETTAPNESNTTHAGVDVTKLSGVAFTVDAVQQAFDEPLDRGDVVAIVQPFFIPTLA